MDVLGLLRYAVTIHALGGMFRVCSGFASKIKPCYGLSGLFGCACESQVNDIPRWKASESKGKKFWTPQNPEVQEVSRNLWNQKFQKSKKSTVFVGLMLSLTVFAGTNNTFQVNESTTLAMIYNDQVRKFGNFCEFSELLEFPGFLYST